MSMNYQNVDPERYKVLIVESDVYRSQRYLLDLSRSEQFKVSAVYGTKREALNYLSRQSVDFVILNVRVSDGNSCDVIRSALRANPNAHVLVITEIFDENTVMMAISAGANGYLLTSDLTGDLAGCLRILQSGGSPVSPLIARSVLKSLHFRTDMGRGHEVVDSPLSPRELDITRLLAKGMSFIDIAQILTISEHTVSTHIKKIYRKLGVHSRGEAVYEARHMGLID